MFDRVYLSPSQRTHTDYAVGVLRRLVDHHLEHPEELPDSYRDYRRRPDHSGRRLRRRHDRSLRAAEARPAVRARRVVGDVGERNRAVPGRVDRDDGQWQVDDRRAAGRDDGLAVLRQRRPARRCSAARPRRGCSRMTAWRSCARERLAHCISGCARHRPCIVGAPAGTILDDEIRDALRRESLVVWLTARSADARTARAWRCSPTVARGDADAWMTTTLAERAPLYESVANLQGEYRTTRRHASAPRRSLTGSRSRCQ